MTENIENRIKQKTKIEERILENQEVILLALSKLLTPQCKGALNDTNGQTKANNRLIDCYHKTRKILGKEYIER